MMNRRLLQTICILALGVGAALAAAARELRVDAFAALVNNRVITAGEVLSLIAPTQQQLRDTYSGPELTAKLEEAYTNGLAKLIDRALILEQFAQEGKPLPDRVVDGHINEIIHDQFNNNRAAFYEALAEDHLNLDDWREETRNRLILMIMRRREITDHLYVAPRAVRDLYEARRKEYTLPEQVRLRVISLHQGASTNEAAVKLALAQRTRARLVAGEDFAAVAKTVSEGAKAAAGGDWGWMEPGLLRKELQGVLQTLPLNQVSPVLAVGGEYYLLRVEERRAASLKPFAAVRDELEAELRRRAGDRLYQEWMQRLRRRFFVKIF